jgi:hypothetical protein
MNSPSFSQQIPSSAMFMNPGGGGGAGDPGFFGGGCGPSPFACACGCGGLGLCNGAPADVVTPDSLTNAAAGILASQVPFSGASVTVDESAHATTVDPCTVAETIFALRSAAAQAYTPTDRDALASMVLTFGAALAIRKVSMDPCAIEDLREKSNDGDAVATAILQGVATMTASDAKRVALVIAAEAAAGNPWAEGQIIGLSQAAECGDLFAQNVIVIVQQIFPQGLPTCMPCSPVGSPPAGPGMSGQYPGPSGLSLGSSAGYSASPAPQMNNGPVMNANAPMVAMPAMNPQQQNFRSGPSPLNSYGGSAPVAPIFAPQGQ